MEHFDRTPRLEAIVFDIGRVLVDFSLEPFSRYLSENECGVLDREEFIERSGMRDYELGRISTEEFLEKAGALAPRPLPPAELRSVGKTFSAPVKRCSLFWKLPAAATESFC